MSDMRQLLCFTRSQEEGRGGLGLGPLGRLKTWVKAPWETWTGPGLPTQWDQGGRVPTWQLVWRQEAKDCPGTPSGPPETLRGRTDTSRVVQLVLIPWGAVLPCRAAPAPTPGQNAQVRGRHPRVEYAFAWCPRTGVCGGCPSLGHGQRGSVGNQNSLQGLCGGSWQPEEQAGESTTWTPQDK